MDSAQQMRASSRSLEKAKEWGVRPLRPKGYWAHEVRAGRRVAFGQARLGERERDEREGDAREKQERERGSK